MKNILLTAFLLVSANLFAQQLDAFPGAEGYGRYATGGRGDGTNGTVYIVTSLDDCDDSNLVEGTLRWALRDIDDRDETPRTVLFAVSGTIHLTSQLKCGHVNLTINGASAPGGGICVAGAKIYFYGQNIIIRYMRFRAGDEAQTSYSSLDVENAENVIIDHCSFSWSMEENVTMYDNRNTTMQWCILSEPLYYSYNIKKQRAYAAQWGGENSSYHHNLLAHCISRSPRLNGARNGDTSIGTHDQFMDTEVLNNVIYNWGNKEAVHGGENYLPDEITGGYVHNNLVNNYYKPGPTTNAYDSKNRWFCRISYDSQYIVGEQKYSQWYVDGNFMEDNEYYGSYIGADHSLVNQDNWYNAGTTNNARAIDLEQGNTAENLAYYYFDTPSLSGLVEMETAQEAYQSVLANAGCILPRRDIVDTRILAEASGEREPIYHGSYKASYLGVIDSQDDLKPYNADDDWVAWPDLSEGNDYLEDTDHDGIPDIYEADYGLDANTFDSITIDSETGYSYLELYLNSIAPDPETDPVLNDIPPVVEEDSEAISTITLDRYEVARFNTLGQRISEGTTGINIIKYSDGSVEKVLIK